MPGRFYGEQEVSRLGKLIAQLRGSPGRTMPGVEGEQALSPPQLVHHAVSDLEMLARLMQDAIDAHPPDYPEAEGWRMVRDKALAAAAQVQATLDG